MKTEIWMQPSAEVKRGRRATSHGPRGDIISAVYSTFPWPVLCAEVAKSKIESRGAIPTAPTEIGVAGSASPPARARDCRFYDDPDIPGLAGPCQIASGGETTPRTKTSNIRARGGV